MKKSLLIPATICALVICAPQFSQSQTPAASTPAPALSTEPQIPPARKLDVDAMAARMNYLHDSYIRLRDAALAVYAKQPPDKYHEINTEQIRLAVYLFLWGDYYREGLWQAYMDNTKKTQDDGPMLNIQESMGMNANHHGTSDSFTDKLRPYIEKMAQSEYPDEFKFQAWTHFANVISKAATVPRDKAAMPKSFAMLPDMMKNAAAIYRKLIRQKVPDDLLITMAMNGFDAVEDDEAALKTLGDELDKAFADEAPDSPVRTTVQGDFYIRYAWNARGTGYSDTITEQGQKLMDERLGKAATILEAAYARHPEIKQTSWCMMTVELGQGQGRQRMETWFQRAIKDDPNYYEAYDAKANYLRARWYGSHEELWAFGIECVKAGNWASKAPTVLSVEAGDLAEDGDGKVFEDPQIWGPLEQFFRAWLDHYPESAIFRSRFVKYAALGKHWDVVKEQTAILGNNWNRATFEGMDYNKLKKTANEEPAAK